MSYNVFFALSEQSLVHFEMCKLFIIYLYLSIYFSCNAFSRKKLFFLEKETLIFYEFFFKLCKIIK